MKCPYCNNHILQKSGDSIKLRTHGQIIIKNDLAETKCFWCKEAIEIPLTISKRVERYFVRKK